MERDLIGDSEGLMMVIEGLRSSYGVVGSKKRKITQPPEIASGGGARRFTVVHGAIGWLEQLLRVAMATNGGWASDSCSNKIRRFFHFVSL